MFWDRCVTKPPGSSLTDVVKILQNYLPTELAEILSSDSEAKHTHRAFIINVSCGESVNNPVTKNMMTAG